MCAAPQGQAFAATIDHPEFSVEKGEKIVPWVRQELPAQLVRQGNARLMNYAS